jgi:hypothetical protein
VAKAVLANFEKTVRLLQAGWKIVGVIAIFQSGMVNGGAGGRRQGIGLRKRR